MKKINLKFWFQLSMMERYLLKELLMSCLLVFGVILAIYCFISFFDEFEDFDFFKAVTITLLSSFDAIYDMAKPILLIGVMLGFSILSSNNELVAMRASGLKFKQIIKVVVFAAMVFSALVYFCGEIINPASQRVINELRQAKQIKLTNSGLWLKNNQGIVRIRTNTDDELTGIYIYALKDNKLSQIKRINRAQITDEGWELISINEQNFSYQNGQVDIQTRYQFLDQQPLDWLDENIFDQIEVRIYDIGMKALWQRIQFLKANGINNNIYWLNLLKRVFVVIDSILIAIFGLFLIYFLPIRSHKTSSRILIGLVIGLSLHLLSQIISQSVLIYNLNPIYANLAMIGVLLLAIFTSSIKQRLNN